MILLARHGQTADNVAPARVQGWRDPPLDEHGVVQAQQLAGRLVGAGIGALYSSHLRRARETALIVADVLQLECQIDERLAESRRGSWEGRLISDIERTQPELWQAYRTGRQDFRFPGGESLAEHTERVCAALGDVRLGKLPALVVCHGGSIRCALSAYRAGSNSYGELAVPNTALVPLK